MAAAAALAAMFVAPVVAPEAHAWPLCDGMPQPTRGVCENYCNRTDVVHDCGGPVPGLPDDCKKYALPSDQARCGDRHIMGQQ
jgi:hypothetical protein